MAALEWLGSFVVLLLLAAWRRWARGREALMRCGESLPGPRPLPVLGNVLDIGFDTKQFLPQGAKWLQEYGPVFRLWAGPELFVLLANPIDVEAILNSTKNLTKSFNYNFLREWLGEGLLTSTGDRWRQHRKILTPTFHFKILEEFSEVFARQGDILVEVLKKRADGCPFDVCPLIDRYTQDVICETAMGIQMRAQTGDSSSEYLQAVRDQCNVLTLRSSQPWFYSDFLFNLSPLGRKQKRNLKILHDMTSKVIAQRKRILEKDPKNVEKLMVDEMGIRRRLAFLDYLLLSASEGAGLTDEDIREEVDTFLFEGHDTTSSAINFAIFELSKRPEVQEGILAELKDVYAPRGGPSYTCEVLGELKYLERVVKETLRMYPSVPLIARKITDEVVLPSVGVAIPPGVTVAISPMTMHRFAFENSHVFDPDNFLPEKMEGKHRFCFLPFSAGSRNCIGQKFAMLEMKSVLSKLVWNFTCELEPGFEPQPVPEITLKSCNGIRISLSKRKR